MDQDNIHIARVSEIGQRLPDSLHSPRVQFRKMREWTEGRGDRILHEWDELDVSAKLPLKRRPKLLRAIEMIEAGDAHNLVFAWFDRSVRNMRVQLEIIDRIEKTPGDIYVLDHGKLTNLNAVGKYMSNVMGSANQFVSDITSEKVTTALIEAIELGRYPIPNVPAGYLRGPDKVLMVNYELVPIIKSAFEMRARRPPASWGDIARYLASHGIQRSHGGARHMLQDRVYLGEVHFGEYENLRAHPPIIDPDLFELVKRTVTKGGRLAKADTLLARLGVLHCGTCDGAMVVNTSANHYRCQQNNHQPCPRPSVANAAKTEALVMDAVRVETAKLRGRAGDGELVRAADAKLERAQLALDKFVRAFDPLADEPSVAERRAEFTKARDRARAERAAIKTKRRITITPDAIDKLPESERLPEWRGLITDMGCRVTVHPVVRRVWTPERFDIQFE